MKGDYSRSTFDPRKHYNSVRMQQGRVQLDADWNEQADILLYLLRSQAQDFLGPHATTAGKQGFAISPSENPEALPDDTFLSARKLPNFWIGAGRCYIDGILCENETSVQFSKQPDYPAAAAMIQQDAPCDQYLVYLNVWQRHITAAEDPSIREVALGGPDTTTRSKTLWQMDYLPLSDDPDVYQGWRAQSGQHSAASWQALVGQNTQPLTMKARWQPGSGTMENCLYRVEIHSAADYQVTFKWSRENGSVVFPITKIEPNPDSRQPDTVGSLLVTVDNLNRDPYQLEKNSSRVEFSDDVTVLNGSPLPLCQVVRVDDQGGQVVVTAEKQIIDGIFKAFGERTGAHPLLRRWESAEQTLTHPSNAADEVWFALENGIEVAFSDSGVCQPGDYWLIPARPQSSDGIIWPLEKGTSQLQAPHSSPHYFAPLALLRYEAFQWSIRPVPASFQTEPAVFQTLPQLTEKLSDVKVALRHVYENLSQIEKDIQSLEGQAEDFSLRLDQLHQSAGKLEAVTDRLSSDAARSHKQVARLETRTKQFSKGFLGLRKRVRRLESRPPGFPSWFTPLSILLLIFAGLLIGVFLGTIMQ